MPLDPRVFRRTDPDFPLSPAVQKLLRDRGRVLGEAGEVLVYARPARPAPVPAAIGADPRRAAP